MLWLEYTFIFLTRASFWYSFNLVVVLLKMMWMTQLQFLEEKQRLSARHSWSSVLRNMEPENQYKTLSSAIEEVHRKGTLMERLAMLENRVLQVRRHLYMSNTARCLLSFIINVIFSCSHLAVPRDGSGKHNRVLLFHRCSA